MASGDGRQPGQVEVKSSSENSTIGFECRDDPIRFEPSLEKAVDGIPN